MGRGKRPNPSKNQEPATPVIEDKETQIGKQNDNDNDSEAESESSESEDSSVYSELEEEESEDSNQDSEASEMSESEDKEGDFWVNLSSNFCIILSFLGVIYNNFCESILSQFWVNFESILSQFWVNFLGHLQ